MKLKLLLVISLFLGGEVFCSSDSHTTITEESLNQYSELIEQSGNILFLGATSTQATVIERPHLLQENVHFLDKHARETDPNTSCQDFNNLSEEFINQFQGFFHVISFDYSTTKFLEINHNVMINLYKLLATDGRLIIDTPIGMESISSYDSILKFFLNSGNANCEQEKLIRDYFSFQSEQERLICESLSIQKDDKRGIFLPPNDHNQLHNLIGIICDTVKISEDIKNMLLSRRLALLKTNLISRCISQIKDQRMSNFRRKQPELSRLISFLYYDNKTKELKEHSLECFPADQVSVISDDGSCSFDQLSKDQKLYRATTLASPVAQKGKKRNAVVITKKQTGLAETA